MPKVNLPKKSQKAFSSEINILRSGKTSILTREQEQTLREDKEAMNGIMNRLRQAAKSVILLIASTKHSHPDFPIIKSAREEIFSAKAMAATFISDLESRLERQQLAKSFALAKELEAKEQSAKAASARVLRDHDRKVKAATKQTRLMVREGGGGPSWALSQPLRSDSTSAHTTAVPAPRLKPYQRRGVLTSTPTSSQTTSSTTPATASTTTSSSSSGAPRKAVPYLSRTGRRRSPRLRERREKEAAKDAELIKRYGLKRLSVVVERLPTNKKKWNTSAAVPVPDGRDYRQTEPPTRYHVPQVKTEPLEYIPTPGPSTARPASPGPELALPILDGVIDSVLELVNKDIQEVFPGPPADWSFDPESTSFIPIISPPLIPSPQLVQVERSNGVIDVFDMGEIPIDQARLLESNIIPQTPDPKTNEVISPRIIQAADSTQTRQIPLIVIDDDDEIQPPAFEVIELE